MSVDISSTGGRHVHEVRTEQYSVSTPYGTTHALHLYPPVADYLDKWVCDKEVVFSQGWGESVATTRHFGEALARAGFATTLFDYPAGNHRAIPTSRVQEYRSEVFDSVLDSIDGDKAVIAHSEGTFSALRAAANRDDVFAALIAAPAGLSGTLTPKELLMCAMTEGKEAIRGTRRNALGAVALAKAFAGLARNVAGSPQLSVAEVHSIATTDALPDLIRAMDRRVRIGILACSEDKLFPAERIEAHLEGWQYLISMYDVLETNHFQFLMRQEISQLVVDRAKQLFAGMSH